MSVGQCQEPRRHNRQYAVLQCTCQQCVQGGTFPHTSPESHPEEYIRKNRANCCQHDGWRSPGLLQLYPLRRVKIEPSEAAARSELTGTNCHGNQTNRTYHARSRTTSLAAYSNARRAQGCIANFQSRHYAAAGLSQRPSETTLTSETAQIK